MTTDDRFVSGAQSSEPALLPKQEGVATPVPPLIWRLERWQQSHGLGPDLLADLAEAAQVLRATPPSLPLPAHWFSFRECRCDQPMVKCDHTGIRCTLCGEPARVQGIVAETDAVAPENVGLPGEIKEAARAVIDRWDTPNWKDAPATAVVINRLRAAISALPVESVQASIADCGNRNEQSGQTLSPAWQSIERAPKDGTWVLVNDTRHSGSTSMARWDDCKYATKPRPYWAFVDERVFGVSASRSNQPTHWLLLPSPPESGLSKTAPVQSDGSLFTESLLNTPSTTETAGGEG